MLEARVRCTVVSKKEREGGGWGGGYTYREFSAVWRPNYVGYRREQHVRPHPRSKRTSGVRLQNLLYEPASYAMSDEEHASRWIIVIRDEEFI